MTSSFFLCFTFLLRNYSYICKNTNIQTHKKSKYPRIFLFLFLFLNLSHLYFQRCYLSFLWQSLLLQKKKKNSFIIVINSSTKSVSLFFLCSVSFLQLILRPAPSYGICSFPGEFNLNSSWLCSGCLILYILTLIFASLPK